MYELKSKKEKIKTFMIFAFIPLFAFVTVLVIPFILGVIMTFTNSNGVNIGDFVGFSNYAEALSEKEFYVTLYTTVKFVFFSMILVNLVGFGLALLVTSGIKGQNAYRSIFFVPNLIGGIILGFIWQFIFGRVLVFIGSFTGIELIKQSWLVDSSKAFWAIIVVTVWQQSGYMMLIYIAGIIGIPKELIEASKVEGASGLQQLIKIKLPLMMQSFTISLFLTLKNAFMMYDVNLSLTGGGPYRSTELITMNIYNDAFLYQKFGTAQAKAVMLFIIVAIIAVLQVYFTKRKEVD